MGQWVRIAGVDAMPAEGGLRAFQLRGMAVCVARIRGELAAVNNECPHRGAPLAEGLVEDGRIVCPWHGWSFDPKTGAELSSPQCAVSAYAVRVEGDDVWCEV